MSWSELFDKGDLLPGQGRRNGGENDFADKNTEQSILYFLPTERRNVNARYPLGQEIDKYRTLGKRYPVAKRSPKEFQQMKRQIMNPKVGSVSINNRQCYFFFCSFFNVAIKICIICIIFFKGRARSRCIIRHAIHSEDS